MASSNSKLKAKTKISTETKPRKAPVKPKFSSGGGGLLTAKIIAAVRENKKKESEQQGKKIRQ
jgi:hypothetical protein